MTVSLQALHLVNILPGLPCFYRASACNACRARYFLAILSVCPSNAGTVSKRTHMSSYFSRSLWSWAPIAVTKFQKKTSAGTLNERGAKMLQTSPFTSETVRARPIVTIKHYYFFKFATSYYYYYYYYQCTGLTDTVTRTMQGHFTES